MILKTEIGHYKANGKIFQTKFEAVLEAQNTNTELSWYFHDDVLQKVNWKSEPELSIDMLYKIRAEQIRNSYDHVIVFCSGGADSNNVIRSFVNNNIKVDEVIGIAPLEGLKNWNYDPNNYSSLNVISETKFALFPLLDELSTKHGIKTTLLDYFDKMNTYKDEEWMVNSCGNIVTTLTSHFTDVMQLPHIRKLIDAGKRVALVYGTDKPMIKSTVDGRMMFVIGDGAINYLNMPHDRSYPNLDRVLFYYSPDLPELMVKQAFIVARALMLPEFKSIYENEVLMTLQKAKIIKTSLQESLESGVNFSKATIFNQYNHRRYEYSVEKDFDYRSSYQRSIVPFIYPTTYTNNLWQARKINIEESFFTRDQDWVHILHKGTRLSEMIVSASKSLYDSISPEYLNSKGTGFKPFSKIYEFGHVSQFSHNILSNSSRS